MLDLDSDGDGVVSFEEWRTALLLATDPHGFDQTYSRGLDQTETAMSSGHLSSDPMPLVAPIPLDPSEPSGSPKIHYLSSTDRIGHIPGIQLRRVL